MKMAKSSSYFRDMKLQWVQRVHWNFPSLRSKREAVPQWGTAFFVIWKQETAPVPRCDGLSGKGDRGKGRRYRQVQAPSPRDWAAALNMEAVRFRSSITCCEKGAIKKSSGPWTGRFAGYSSSWKVSTPSASVMVTPSISNRLAGAQVVPGFSI